MAAFEVITEVVQLRQLNPQLFSFWKFVSGKKPTSRFNASIAARVLETESEYPELLMTHSPTRIYVTGERRSNIEAHSHRVELLSCGQFPSGGARMGTRSRHSSARGRLSDAAIESWLAFEERGAIRRVGARNFQPGSDELNGLRIPAPPGAPRRSVCEITQPANGMQRRERRRLSDRRSWRSRRPAHGVNADNLPRM